MRRLVEGVNERFLVAVARGRACRWEPYGRWPTDVSMSGGPRRPWIDRRCRIVRARFEAITGRRGAKKSDESLGTTAIRAGSGGAGIHQEVTPLSLTAAGSSLAPPGQQARFWKPRWRRAGYAGKLAALAGGRARRPVSERSGRFGAKRGDPRAGGGSGREDVRGHQKQLGGRAGSAARYVARDGGREFGIGAEGVTGAKRRTVSPEPGASVPAAAEEDELKDLRAMTRRVAAKGGTKR